MDGAAGEFEGGGGGGGVQEVGGAGCVVEEGAEGEGDGEVGVERKRFLKGVEIDGCGDRLDVLEVEARRGAEVEGVFEVGSESLRSVNLMIMGS